MLLIRRILGNPRCPSLDPKIEYHKVSSLHARIINPSLCPYPVRRNASYTNTLYSTSRYSHVASLLRDYGFTDPQISSFAKKDPFVFKRSAVNLLPKLNFLRSIGLSDGNIQKIVVQKRSILSSSLKNQLIPIHDFLRGVPLNDNQIIQVILRYSRILASDRNKVLIPNIEWLKENGATPLSIETLMLYYTNTLCRNHETFKTNSLRTVALGFTLLGKKFMPALHVITCQTDNRWNIKVNLFKKFGVADNEFLSLFRRQPVTMGLSVKNIERKHNFFVGERRCTPAVIVKCPTSLLYSFERRIVPRCVVMEKLSTGGLTSKISIPTFLSFSEEAFFDRFVLPFKEEFPELLDTYCNAVGRSLSP